MKPLIVFASIAVASGLLLVNMYTSIVDARSWGSNIPESIGVAREYFRVVNPGNFFRIFSPLNQLLGLVALVICWRSSGQVRLLLGIALVMYLVAEGMTFMYFYPRNDIMFKTAALTDTALLKKTWSQWNSMNWVRTAVLVIGLCCSATALDKYYSLIRK